MTTLGQNIRAARKAAGQTQNCLARRVDCTVTHIAHIEQGRATPSYTLSLKIAVALDTSAAKLYEGVELAGTEKGKDDE